MATPTKPLMMDGALAVEGILDRSVAWVAMPPGHRIIGAGRVSCGSRGRGEDYMRRDLRAVQREDGQEGKRGRE